MPERVPVLLYTVGLWLGNCAREGTSAASLTETKVIILQSSEAQYKADLKRAPVKVHKLLVLTDIPLQPWSP